MLGKLEICRQIVVAHAQRVGGWDAQLKSANTAQNRSHNTKTPENTLVTGSLLYIGSAARA